VTPTTCSAALSQAAAAQTAVSSDLKTVAHDEDALNSALESSSSSSSSQTESTAGHTATTTTASGSSSAKAVSPEQLAVDQAAIDTADANVSNAQEAAGDANLVSTIAGTVASVGVATGDSVTAGSTSTPAFVVIGSGSSYEVSVPVSVTDIAEVAVGQQAEVTPDSTNAVEGGRVSAIGVLGTSATSGTTYPVTVTLDAADLGQFSGADADVSIVVKKATDVATVPSSAVRTVGTIHLVTEVNGTTPKEVRVTIGTVGPLLTQVTSGVKVGQQVSLADLQEPLPSTSSSTTRTGFGGTGGLGGLGGGTGFGGGGFTGGGRFGG
jgi:biotin carboxyl carrier protein